MKTPLWLIKTIKTVTLLLLCELALWGIWSFADSHTQLTHPALWLFIPAIIALLVAVFGTRRIWLFSTVLLASVMTADSTVFLWTPNGYTFPPQTTNEVWNYLDTGNWYTQTYTNLDWEGNQWAMCWDEKISNLIDPGQDLCIWNLYVRTNQGPWSAACYYRTGWVSFGQNNYSSNWLAVTYDWNRNPVSTNHGKAAMDEYQNMSIVDSNGVAFSGVVSSSFGPLWNPMTTSFSPQQTIEFRLMSPQPQNMDEYLAEQGGGMLVTNSDGSISYVSINTSGPQPNDLPILGIAVVGVILVLTIWTGIKLKKILEPIWKATYPSTNCPAPGTNSP